MSPFPLIQCGTTQRKSMQLLLQMIRHGLTAFSIFNLKATACSDMCTCVQCLFWESFLNVELGAKQTLIDDLESELHERDSELSLKWHELRMAKMASQAQVASIVSAYEDKLSNSRKRLENMFARVTCASAAAAHLHAWRAHTEHLLTERRVAQLEEFSHKAEAATKIAAEAAATAFVRSQSAVENQQKAEQIRRRAVTQRVAQKLTVQVRNAVVKTFNDWVGIVEESQRAKLILFQRTSRIAAFIARSRLHRSLQEWRDATIMRNEEASKNLRLLRRWKLQSASRSFRRWREVREEQERHRLLLRRICHRTRSTTISKAVISWKSAVIAQQREQEEAERRGSIMGRIALRFMRRTLTLALERWMSAASEAADARTQDGAREALLRRCAMRMLNLVLR